MNTPLIPADVQAVLTLVQTSPDAPGVFDAFFTVLENASDSGVVIAALGALDRTKITDHDQCRRIADLLTAAGDTELAETWRSVPDEDAGNVVALRPETGASSRPRPTGPQITFDDIAGLEKVKDQIRRKIIKPFENPGLFQKYKRKAGGGVLMYGPPGCGKTMLARAVAHQANASFVEVRAAEILDRYIGVAEGRIVDLFDEARASRPAVLFFDEIEALAQRRQFNSNTSVNTVVSALLTEMDAFDNRNEGILFLGATNIPWSLDSAFRRPGRFDRTLFVPPPDRLARAHILKNLLEDRPVSKELDLEALVKETSGFSGADLMALVETAVDYAIDTSIVDSDIALITNGHFAEAFEEVIPTTGDWLAEARNFSKYANESGMYKDLQAFLKSHTR
ncbi:MAG: ATP-binding protein [Pseudomonadota bacterium]